MNDVPRKTTDEVIKPEAKPYAYAAAGKLFWDRQEAIAAAEKTPVYHLYTRDAFNR